MQLRFSLTSKKARSTIHNLFHHPAFFMECRGAWNDPRSSRRASGQIFEIPASAKCAGEHLRTDGKVRQAPPGKHGGTTLCCEARTPHCSRVLVKQPKIATLIGEKIDQTSVSVPAQNRGLIKANAYRARFSRARYCRLCRRRPPAGRAFAPCRGGEQFVIRKYQVQGFGKLCGETRRCRAAAAWWSCRAGPEKRSWASTSCRSLSAEPHPGHQRDRLTPMETRNS